MTECYRKQVRADLDLVFLSLSETDDDTVFPGWYLQRPGSTQAYGPFVTQQAALTFLPTLVHGVNFPTEVSCG